MTTPSSKAIASATSTNPTQIIQAPGFFNWYTSEDPTPQAAFQSLTAYKSSVAGQTIGLFQTDDDFINALGDALGDDADALSLLSDSVRIFHPTSLGHQTIRNVMEAALEAAGVPEPLAVSSAGTPAPTQTVTSASAAATCNCNEDDCTDDSPACCANGTCQTSTPSPSA